MRIKKILCCWRWCHDMFLIPHDVCAAQEMSNKWQILDTYLFLSLTLAHQSFNLICVLFYPHRQFLYLLTEIRIKNSYLCGIIGETRFFIAEFFYCLFFFAPCWFERQKQHFLCSFDKHKTYDSRLNISLETCIGNYIAIFGIFSTFISSFSSFLAASYGIYTSISFRSTPNYA